MLAYGQSRSGRWAWADAKSRCPYVKGWKFHPPVLSETTSYCLTFPNQATTTAVTTIPWTRNQAKRPENEREKRAIAPSRQPTGPTPHVHTLAHTTCSPLPEQPATHTTCRTADLHRRSRDRGIIRRRRGEAYVHAQWRTEQKRCVRRVKRLDHAVGLGPRRASRLSSLDGWEEEANPTAQHKATSRSRKGHGPATLSHRILCSEGRNERAAAQIPCFRKSGPRALNKVRLKGKAELSFFLPESFYRWFKLVPFESYGFTQN
jgi:hypothetical protein